MSVVSHHFQQQRKADGAQQQRTALKPQPQPAAASKPSSSSVAAGGVDVRALAQAARVDTYGWEDLTDTEVLLRKFDMDSRFGPATGLTRKERWQRATDKGLNPPAYIAQLIDSLGLKENEGSKPQFKAGSGSHSVFHTTVHGNY